MYKSRSNVWPEAAGLWITADGEYSFTRTTEGWVVRHRAAFTGTGILGTTPTLNAALALAGRHYVTPAGKVGNVVTGSEMAQYIGRTGGYRPSRDLNFEVRVVDVRMRYGTLDVQIAPVAGNGTQWVSALNVTLDY